MNNLYPNSHDEIGAWARANQVTTLEAEVRFAQYGILRAITGSQRLSQSLVFKGGNALDLIWSPNRSTKDLDFSSSVLVEPDDLRRLLQAGLDAAERALGTMYRVQRVERQPRDLDKPFATYAVSIGYALSSHVSLRARIQQGNTSSLVIPMDVSINEVICEDESVALGGQHALRVSTREDIVAEKLRSLLQQTIRNRYRRQDLLDITATRRRHPLDLQKVAVFLEQKSATRGVSVSRAAFRVAELERRARQDYDDLRDTTRSVFIPFDDAWRELLDLVDALDIPP